MASKNEFELAIKIAGMIDESLNSACNLTKKQLRGIAKEAADASKGTISFGTAMENAGAGIDGAWNMATGAVKTTVTVLAAATGAAIAASGVITGVGSEFESAFAGVKKTVDATEQQLEDLEEGLRLMARNKPQTAVELAEIAEAAGQLGIHTENIEDFTSTMADLKVATNLGDEGAEQFAKFANIVQMSQDKFENLGSTVVALGNNTATTEADIMAMSMRVAGAGHQVGMSEADILGFSAALSSVGIEAEAGGSAISKVMINMQLAVEKGGDDLAQFAKISGMSSKEFKKAFKEDAAGAISAFITGLNDTERLGQSAIAVLDDMDIKEVRLRDTLLRGANASELFRNTLDLSSKAFEENTALTREAEQRYVTFESRMEMLNNRIKDVGITLYKDFRPGLSDALGVAMDFTDELGMLDDDYLKGLADNFQKSIPTVVRQLGDAKEAVVRFAGPFIEVGDWMIEHPDVIAGTLAGIGTTIATLKLVKTINGVTTSLNTLRLAMMSNPVLAAAGLAAMAGGALIGLSTKVKIANDKLKKQDLAKHFGTISLSMEDLDQAAKQILGIENRKNLDLFMDQLKEMDTITGKLEQHQRMLGKLNWKIEMGIELTEADRENYTAAIDGYVETSIAAIEQQHYTANVAVQTLFKGKGGEEIISSFDQFYLSTQADISAAGKRLGDVYHDAMEDGIVSPIEQETIERLTKELQQIQERVMESKRNVAWDVMTADYLNAGKLDVESFFNLMDQIDNQAEKDMSTYRESYETTMSTNQLILDSQLNDPNATDFKKKVAQQEYDAAHLAANNQYQDRRIETSERAIKLTLNTLDTQYPEVMGQLDEFTDFIGKYLNDSIANNSSMWEMNTSEQYIKAIKTIKNSPEIEQASRDAMEEILKGIAPQVEDWQAIADNYKAQGKKVPESIQKGLNDVALIRAILGDEGEIVKMMDDHLASSPEAVELLNNAEKLGSWVPESISKGLGDTDSIDDAISNLRDHAEKELISKFGNMTVYGDVDFNLGVGRVTTRQSSSANPNAGRGNNDSAREVFIPGHADGGIFDTPHLAWFAEEGPEAAIPIDGSQNAKSIWREVGEMMGVLEPEGTGGGGRSYVTSLGRSSSAETTNKSESQIIYSPTYQVYGSSVDTVKQATNDDYRRFESFMRQYEKSKARLSF